jgi:hypothetical protein
MKFYSVTSEHNNAAALQAEYASGRVIGNVNLGAEFLFFKEKRKVYYIPYADMTRCFRRVLLVQTKMCCGKGNLEVENLVVCSEKGEVAQIQLPGERAGKILLEEIVKIAPHVQIGRAKENNDGK